MVAPKKFTEKEGSHIVSTSRSSLPDTVASMEGNRTFGGNELQLEGERKYERN